MEIRGHITHPIVLHFALGIALLSFYLGFDVTENLELLLTGVVFLPFYLIWLANVLESACWRTLWIAGPLVIPKYAVWLDDRVQLEFGLGVSMFALLALIMLAARRYFVEVRIVSEGQSSRKDVGLAAATLLLASLSVGIGLNGEFLSSNLGYGPEGAIPVAAILLFLCGKARPGTISFILIGLVLLHTLLSAGFPDTYFFGFRGDIEFGDEHADWRIGWNSMVPWACGLGIATVWGARFVLGSFNQPQKPARLLPVTLLLIAFFAAPAMMERTTEALGREVAGLVPSETAQVSQSQISTSGVTRFDDVNAAGQIVVTAKRQLVLPDLVVDPFWLILLGGLAYAFGRRAPKASRAWLPTACALLATVSWLGFYLLDVDEINWFEAMDWLIEEALATRIGPLIAIILTVWVAVWLGAYDVRRREAEDIVA